MGGRISPTKYAEFSMRSINHYNYDVLWKELKKIEAKYKTYKTKINYENREDANYNISDWESELCYEQGKFIENVVWTDRPIIDVPETEIPYCTYRKMNYQQLKYYLYWRSCFRKGENIETGYRTFYYLYAYELIAEFGTFSPLQRLEQLERLYKNFKSSLSHAHWVREYADFHGLEIQDEVVKGWADYKKGRSNPEKRKKESMYAIIQGNYSGVFDVMYNISAWKIKTHGSIRKAKCIENIAESVTIMMPRFEKLFAEAGLIFSDFLVGKMEKIENYIQAYEGSIWNHCVVSKFGIDVTKSTKVVDYKMIYQNSIMYFTDVEGNYVGETDSIKDYCDPYLSEYILKYTEMLFRKEMSYNCIEMPSKPIGTLNVKIDGYGHNYVLPEDEELQRREKIYFSLYDNIESIIIDSVHEYMKDHSAEIAVIKESFSKKSTPTKSCLQEKKMLVDELMIDFISKSKNSEGQVEKLIEIYNKATPKYKKIKAKKFSCWIWDYWLLHANKITYGQLNEIVLHNKWNIFGIQALQERRFAEAVSYLRTYYDPCTSVIAKKIDGRVIVDSIVIALICIDQICKSKGIDFIELLLGKFDTYDWIIYDDEQIRNNITTPIIKNVGNVQIYQFDPNKNISVVNRHSYSQESKDFIVFLLKSIDNHYRTLIGYKSYLKIEFAREKLDSIPGAGDVLPIINEVISIITKFTFDYNKPIFHERALSEDVQITGALNREYSFVCCSEIKDIRTFVRRKIKEYYSIGGNAEIKSNRPYEAFELDLYNFNIHEWSYRYQKRERIKQRQASVQLYHFYDSYRDIVDRLMTVKSYVAEYDPNFNFLASKVLRDVNGLVNKDIKALLVLCDDPADFMQWIEWVKRGKFVYSKNEPYVQILFHFIFNDWVLSDNRTACLVMMCEICNYYFKDKEKLGWGFDLYLEWIKDYWMLYCSDEVSYEEFKSLFIYDIEFYNANRRNVNENVFVDIDTLDKTHLLQFYNTNCNYRVLERMVVKSGYRFLLEDALEAVHVSLKKLWAKYDMNFKDYFYINEEIFVDKTREVFYRAILTNSTKKRIAKVVDRVRISDTEEYTCEYDYDKKWPVFKCQIKETCNAASCLFMEYIIRLTENGIRKCLGMPYVFNLNARKLYETFSVVDLINYQNTDLLACL